jgi:alkylation response protein AidB-like acyl-CoA dehydrogenase
MLLTESCAGSDVGALETTAVRNEDGSYTLSGSKIFITNGEHDLCENIIHPVLARIEGDPPGTSGISIFIVPKYFVNDDGSLGERNGIFCTGVEEKLGIHGSATCSMGLGGNTPCIGYLLGNGTGGHEGDVQHDQPCPYGDRTAGPRLRLGRLPAGGQLRPGENPGA